MPARRLAAVASLCGGVAMLAVVGMSAPPAPQRHAMVMQLAQTADPETGTFGVSGTKHGFFPGGGSTMTLVITNPNAFAIEVEQVRATATSSSPACPVSDVSFGALGPGTIVASQSSKTADIPVAMALGAPDACQGATFTLTFSGTAGPAPGVVVPAPTQAPTQVLGATQQRPNALARTGLRSAAMVAGLVLVAAGAVLTLAGSDRRRRRETSA